MTRDVSPILDRHTQDDIGRKLRERLATPTEQPSEIDRLLATLRATGAGERTQPQGR